MSRNLIRDETGMAMGLTIIMVLLISVMGAGLLSFVMRDIDSVIETNKGQRALDIAEAGVQAAKSQLRVDSFRQHYDTIRANDCNEGPRVGGQNWSKATEIFTDPTGYCTGASTRAANQVGVTRSFAGGKFTVTIECFRQDPETAANSPCQGGATNPDGTPQDPPTTSGASGTKYFKITSTGCDTNANTSQPCTSTTESGAIRKVEAIYETSKKVYLPVAYYTPKSIIFSGTQSVSRMSFFAGQNIQGVIRGGANIADRATPAIYTDWFQSGALSPYNTAPRISSTGAPITGAGFGAVGKVCGASNTCTSTTASVADGRNDYDSTTATTAGGQGKRFVFKRDASGNPAPTRALAANEISFPFDPGTAIDNPPALVPPDLLEELLLTAQKQGNYRTCTGTCDITTWPGKGSLVFIDGQPGSNLINMRVSTGAQPEGVLVVRNTNIGIDANSLGFRGVIIAIGSGDCSENLGAGRGGNYTQAGSAQLDGYVASSGCQNIRGSVSPSTTIDFTNLLSLFDLKLWSWREVYQ